MSILQASVIFPNEAIHVIFFYTTLAVTNLSTSFSEVFHNEDDWEPVYRVYGGYGWDSHDDYLSQARTAEDGDDDDSQFRSWKVDQWRHNKIAKVC